MSESEYDALRRAFDDLAAEPPLVLGRRGAVMQQIEARRRRIAVFRSALSAVFLASVSVGAVKAIQARPASDAIVQHDPSPSGQPETPPSKSPSPKPKPTPAVTATKSVAPAPKPTAKPTSEKTYLKPTAKPAPPAQLVTYVWADPAEIVAGQQTTVTVKVLDQAGRTLRIDLDFGDGTRTTLTPPSSCAEQGSKVRYTFPHTYAKAAKYYLTAKVVTGGCGAADESATTSSKVYVHASAPAESPKPSYVNGPAQPAAGGEQVTGELADHVYLALSGADTDGFVRKVYVDWGDGTTTIAGEWSVDSCTNADGKDFPKPTSRQVSTKHKYASPGSYPVTVKVKSVACDGGDEQLGYIQFSITAP